MKRRCLRDRVSNRAVSVLLRTAYWWEGEREVRGLFLDQLHKRTAARHPALCRLVAALSVDAHEAERRGVQA